MNPAFDPVVMACGTARTHYISRTLQGHLCVDTAPFKTPPTTFAKMLSLVLLHCVLLIPTHCTKRDFCGNYPAMQPSGQCNQVVKEGRGPWDKPLNLSGDHVTALFPPQAFSTQYPCHQCSRHPSCPASLSQRRLTHRPTFLPHQQSAINSDGPGAFGISFPSPSCHLPSLPSVPYIRFRWVVDCCKPRMTQTLPSFNLRTIRKVAKTALEKRA